jgi:hypothetical protein
MKALQQSLSQLEGADTQVLGVSMDSPFSNFAFAQQNGVSFPILGDWGGRLLFFKRFLQQLRVFVLSELFGKRTHRSVGSNLPVLPAYCSIKHTRGSLDHAVMPPQNRRMAVRLAGPFSQVSASEALQTTLILEATCQKD